MNLHFETDISTLNVDFYRISPNQDLTEVIHVLNASHETVADEFGFTRESNPTNNAFINDPTLRTQLNKGIELYSLSIEEEMVGCIAIERSNSEEGLYYIEKVSVIPKFRNHGLGHRLMQFAINKIKEYGGKRISIALIDSNTSLKKWYLSQGFVVGSTKDFKHLPFKVCFMDMNL